MGYETIKVDVQGGVLIITLNRPAARNAMNSKMMEEFSGALERWDDDPSLRVCVVTNEGSCFCAGADLKELAAGTYRLPAGKEDWGLLGMAKHRFKKPLITAVNGVCVGGGMGLLLACDLAICSRHSTFGLPEARHGRASTGDGAILRLMQQIPHKCAAELILTGDPIDAQRAESWGLVSRVVDEEALMPCAQDGGRHREERAVGHRILEGRHEGGGGMRRSHPREGVGDHGSLPRTGQRDRGFA